MPAAPMWCEDCSCESAAIYCEQREDWHPSCCWSLCERCEYVERSHCGTCEQCEDCCSCSYCSGCSEMIAEPSYAPALCENCEQCESCCECFHCYGCGSKVTDLECSTCEHCESCGCSCECDDCGCSHCGAYGCGICCECVEENRRNARVPGWVARGDVLPNSAGDASPLLSDFRGVDPVRGMADFYLLEWILAVIARRNRFGNITLHNSGGARLARIRNAAYTLQRYVVQQCDTAFRDYVFLAIGGEARHHVNVRGSLSMGRESMWDYWHAMGESIGREQCTRDAVDLFRCESWSGGYGGSAWETCAKTLLMREDGTLDARTFVDRCFSLQHNSGSLLNKVAWSGESYPGQRTGAMRSIGNAHHRSDLATLARYASQDARDLLLSCVPLGGYLCENEEERESLGAAVQEIHAGHTPDCY